jgi:hypothetical protein
MKIFPSMKVPVVSTTALAPMRLPRSVTTPSIRLPEASVRKSTTVSMKISRPGCRSTAARAAAW